MSAGRPMKGWGHRGQYVYDGSGWQKGKGQVAAPLHAHVHAHVPASELYLPWHCISCGANYNWGTRLACRTCGELKPNSWGWDANRFVGKGMEEEQVKGCWGKGKTAGPKGPPAQTLVQKTNVGATTENGTTEHYNNRQQQDCLFRSGGP